jgi:hypothetical protein
MELQSVTTGNIQLIGVPGRYLPSVRTTRRIRAPRAYAVPSSCVKLLDVLARQRFATVSLDQFRSVIAEAVRLPARRSAGEAPPPRVERAQLDGHTIFPTAQAGGRMLALLLDPESQFGAHRYRQLEIPVHPGALHPVVRLA